MTELTNNAHTHCLPVTEKSVIDEHNLLFWAKLKLLITELTKTTEPQSVAKYLCKSFLVHRQPQLQKRPSEVQVDLAVTEIAEESCKYVMNCQAAGRSGGQLESEISRI
jgi:hypothetical protein